MEQQKVKIRKCPNYVRLLTNANNKIIHLNVCNFLDKYDKLKLLLTPLAAQTIQSDFVLLFETFRTDIKI